MLEHDQWVPVGKQRKQVRGSERGQVRAGVQG